MMRYIAYAINRYSLARARKMTELTFIMIKNYIYWR